MCLRNTAIQGPKAIKSKSLKPIKLGAPGDEIGKKDLNTVKRRFLNLHKLRFRRVQQFLQPDQRIFLDLLPLLFHRNTPALPGFVSSDTLAGIRDYAPNKSAVSAAKSLSKSFIYKRRALKHYPIDAIYLMGSVGSIAYSNKSDLDIWLCYQSKIDSDFFDELQEKTTAIEKWAESLRLDVHFHPIDTGGSKDLLFLPASQESSGIGQHHLLLEEFYRTGLHIAGKIPAWWLVPPEQENDYETYVAHLKNKRFVDEHEIIDFGGMNKVDPQEFLDAASWQLYQSISAPYKSMLKLLLIEAYATEYPNTFWLCLIIKKAIFEGSVDVNELDSYMLTLNKVETVLSKQNDAQRLNLARRCFYIKINELLCENTSYAPRRLRREMLQSMTYRWGWNSRMISELDSHTKWKYKLAAKEQELIAEELKRAYKFLRHFAAQNAIPGKVENENIKLLGRKLNACLERKPGKIDTLYTARSHQLEEQALTLSNIKFADNETGWQIFIGYIKGKLAGDAVPLKKSRNIVELLAWAALNGLYSKQTHIFLDSEDSPLQLRELQAMLRDLSRFLHQQSAPQDSLDAYSLPAHSLSSALFINVGLDPMETGTEGLQITSNRSDALSYSSLRTNLVLSVDALVISSWQEVLLRSYTGLHGLLDCLTELINQAPSIQQPPKVECFSYGSSRSQSIANRVNQLYDQLSSRFSIASDALRLRYVLRGRHRFFIVHNHNGSLSYFEVANMSQLMAELSQPQPIYSRVKFDSAALDDSPLPLIFNHHRPGKIQIFLRKRRKKTDLYILDENGSLFKETKDTVNLKSLAEPFYYFLFSTLRRYKLTFDSTIEYFFIEKEPSEAFQLKQINLDLKPENEIVALRVVAHDLDSNYKDTTIYCDNQEFSSMEFGTRLFEEVANHIVALRRSADHYPIYITDIDVPHTLLGASAHAELQTIHLLKYKKKIESRLNESVSRK